MRKPKSSDLYLRLLPYVRPYRRQFSGGIVAMILLAATEPGIPALMKPLLWGAINDPTYP